MLKRSICLSSHQDILSLHLWCHRSPSKRSNRHTCVFAVKLLQGISQLACSKIVDPRHSVTISCSQISIILTEFQCESGCIAISKSCQMNNFAHNSSRPANLHLPIHLHVGHLARIVCLSVCIEDRSPFQRILIWIIVHSKMQLKKTMNIIFSRF